MKNLKKFLSGGVLSVLLVCLMLTGCGKKPSLELSSDNNVYEIAPGGSLQLNVEKHNIEDGTIEFEIAGTDQASVSPQGVLTVGTGITVGTVVKVTAKIGDVKSNQVSVNVVDLLPQSIDLVASNTKFVKGGSITFNLDVNPAYATVKDYTLAIVGGTAQNDVELNEGVLTVKAASSNEDVIGKTVIVRATLVGDNTKTDEVEIKIIDNRAVANISANPVTFVAGQPAAINVDSFDADDHETVIDMEAITFTSNNTNIVEVDGEGNLVAKGHGSAVVTINYAGKTTTCNVNVIVAPEAIELAKINTVDVTNNEYFLNGGTLYYSSVDPLNLEFTAKNHAYEDRCTTSFTYDWSHYVGGALQNSGANVATKTANGYEIKPGITGDVRVKVTTYSTIGGRQVAEKSMTLNLNVNTGINVDTVAQFKAYANQETNTVVNVLGNLYLTETENFGVESNDGWATLRMYGDRYINGNGWALSCEYLPLRTNNTDANDFLQFHYDDRPGATLKPITVQIRDLSIVGVIDATAAYTGALKEYDAYRSFGAMLNSEAGIKMAYDRGLMIRGGDYNYDKDKNQEDYTAASYGKDVVLDNVKVSGFEMGIRLGHLVNARLSDVFVDKCFANGIESNQNTMTVHNLEIGKVGAFGIEIVPDDIRGAFTATPSGTAGVGYNETPEIKFTGTFTSNNFTNGVDTPYMQGLASMLGGIAGGGEMTMVQLVQALVDGNVDGILASSGQSENDALADIMTKTALSTLLGKNGNGETVVDLYTLIFINKADGGKFLEYDGGNVPNPNNENKRPICEYTFEADDSGIINMQTLLINIATAASQGKTYDAYKACKYIEVDIDTNGTQVEGNNYGQAIMKNLAYDPTYVPVAPTA